MNMQHHRLRRSVMFWFALALCAGPASFAAESPPAQRSMTAAPAAPPPQAPPTRSPLAADAPKFTVLAAPGANPPPDRDGNFVIGPTYAPPRELEPAAGIPAGRVEQFTLDSADSRFYPGIARVAA